MTPAVRVVVVIALVALAAAGILAVAGSPRTDPAPTTVPSPPASAAAVIPATATPSVRPSPSTDPTTAPIVCRSPMAPTCVGRLEPGTHDTGSFVRPFTYTVPADWWNLDDLQTTFQLHRYGDPADQQILVYHDPGIAPTEDGCAGTAIEGADASAEDWVRFFTTHPGLDVSEPVAVDVGGRSATAIDIAVRDGWTASCPAAEGRPYVRYATDLYWPFDGWGIAEGNRRRVILLDGPAGSVLLIEVSTNTPERFAGFVDAAMPIVQSVTFHE